MSQPYVGEIRMFAGNFAPAGWMFCEGQLLPISEYETLFNLIGTTYGGDGTSTFALPNLQGRLPLHQGSGFALACIFRDLCWLACCCGVWPFFSGRSGQRPGCRAGWAGFHGPAGVLP